MNNRFAQQWLEIVCAQLPNVESAVFILPDPQTKDLRPLAKWPADLSAINEFSAVVKYTLKKQQEVYFPRAIEADQLTFDLFALPVFIQKTLLGILVIKTKHQAQVDQKTIFSTLKQSTHWLTLASARSSQSDDFYSTVVSLLTSCFEQNSYHQGLISMVTELTKLFRCERVAFAEYQGHYSRVVALSNSASFDQRSSLIQKITAAMDEAIEQDAAIIFPDSESKLIQRAHQELARKFGAGSICSIPLVNHHEIFGAICLLRDEDSPFDQQSQKLLQQTFALLTPFLALKKEQEKGLLSVIGKSLKTQLSNLFGFRFLKGKLISIAILLLVAAGSVIEGDFRVSSNAVLEGKVQRVIAAPFSGYLLSATVRAGDTVRKGQIMASLNDADLQLQLTKLQGELQKARREYREAQSIRDLVKVSIVSEQINQTTAEIELAQQQLERIHLAAPFDGVVIEGDLSQSLGSPVERGEALFKIAPLDGYRIILKIDESDIAHIKQKQTGTLVLPSLSKHDLPLIIEKITVAAKAEDGANIFRVEASLNGSFELLRPGMQGVGKINIGRERLIWIYTREITDWLRLWVWSWWP